MMANSTNPGDPVEGTEIYSTEAVKDALLEESALENSDSLHRRPKLTFRESEELIFYLFI